MVCPGCLHQTTAAVKMSTSTTLVVSNATTSDTTARKRQPNWSKDDCLLLAELVKANKRAIEGKFSPTCTSAGRQETWQKITDRINASSSSSRTKDEVIKKWKNFKTVGKKSFSSFNRASTATGGGPAPTPISPVTEAIVDCIGRDNTVLTGVVPMVMDSTFLQLLELEQPLDGVHNPEDLQISLTPSGLQNAPVAVSAQATAVSTPPQSTLTPMSEVQFLMREKLLIEIEVLKMKREHMKRKYSEE